MYNEAWGRISAVLMFIGFNVTFFPQFILGYLGMPRRYHVYPAEFQLMNIMSSAGATILAFAYVFPFVYLLYSLCVRQEGARQPVGGEGTGVDDDVAAAAAQLHQAAGRRLRGLRLRSQGAGSMSEALADGVGLKVIEQFEDQEQQRNAGQLGMWAWLVTELLLFAGLFLIATVLRVQYPDSVHRSVAHLKFWIGATNTGVLIVSSLTMSGAIQASRLGLQRADRLLHVRHGGSGLAVHPVEALRVVRRHRRAHGALAEPALRTRRRQAVDAVHQPLLGDDRIARSAPDGRA